MSGNTDPLSGDPPDSDLIGASTSGFAIYGDIAQELGDIGYHQLDRSIADPTLHPDVFRVRLARPRTLNEDAGTLVRRRYEWRGYQTESPKAEVGLYTFAAYNTGELVGTIGVRLDTEVGLPADELYKSEIDTLRAHGHRLAEFTRLAVDESAASKEVLGALFHTAVLYAHKVRGCSHVIIEVNPRHVAFYRRVLFFKQIAEERHLEQIGAPAVLLELEFATLIRAIGEFFSAPNWQERTKSFFANWFSPCDVLGILARLERLDDERHALMRARATPTGA